MQRSILTPAQAAWLDATMARNTGLYGGFTMKDDGGDGGGDGGSGGDAGDGDKGGDAGKDDEKSGADKSGKDDEKLGDAGLRALESERKARKDLKAELDTLKTGLASALGIKNDAEDDGDDKALLEQIQQQINGMQREAAVLTIANTHKITDTDDLALLRSAKDEDHMKKLAERLAPAEGDTGAKPGRRPRPDPSQGGGDGGSNSSRGGSVAEVMAARRAEREKKSSATS